MSSISGGIDGVEVRFDEGSLVADAGLLLAGTVTDRLGLEAMVDEMVRPPGSGRGSGATVLSVVASMLVGGSLIDDADRLRSGSTAQVLPFAVSTPSTLGTWLRSLTFGHVRQFDRANELALSGAWSMGAAPVVEEMTIDLDSTICEVHGHQNRVLVMAPQNAKVKTAVTAIDDKTWKPIAYTRGGEAQVAETTIETGRRYNKDPANCGSWCAAHGSSAPKPSCGPTGATTP